MHEARTRMRCTRRSSGALARGRGTPMAAWQQRGDNCAPSQHAHRVQPREHLGDQEAILQVAPRVGDCSGQVQRLRARDARVGGGHRRGGCPVDAARPGPGDGRGAGLGGRWALAGGGVQGRAQAGARAPAQIAARHAPAAGSPAAAGSPRRRRRRARAAWSASCGSAGRSQATWRSRAAGPWCAPLNCWAAAAPGAPLP